MTTRELLERVKMTKTGTGCYRITIMYRGKTYNETTNNSMLYDAYRSCDPYTKESCCGYTFRQAIQHAYNLAKRANGI